MITALITIDILSTNNNITIAGYNRDGYQICSEKTTLRVIQIHIGRLLNNA